MRRVGKTALFLLLAVLCFSSFGAEVVGEAFIDGRKVILKSDGSWDYSKSSAEVESGDCDTVGEYLLCLNQTGWAEATPHGDMQLMYQRGDIFFGVVSEGIGREDGVSYSLLRDHVLKVLADRANKPVSSINQIDHTEDFAGLGGSETIVYASEIDGLPVVYHNTMKILPGQTVQFIVFTVGSRSSAEVDAAARSVIENIRLRAGLK